MHGPDESAAIIGAALDCIITMDHAGRVLDFNAAATATFGYERDAVIGRRLADIIIPPDLRDAHERALEAYVREGRTTILGRRLELTAMRADGSTFPVELAVARMGRSEPPRFVGFIRDITERDRADRAYGRALSAAVSARGLAEAAQERSAVAQEIAEDARAEAEAAGRRLTLLADAGRLLIDTRDPASMMRDLAALVTRDAADFCTVTVADPGTVRVVGAAHADPRLAGVMQRLARDFPPPRDAPAGPAAVIRSARTELLAPVTDAALGGIARDREHERLLRELAPAALLTVPLKTAKGVHGALTLGRTGPRGFEPADVTLAETLAARAALALENARLFAERSQIAETLQRGLLPAAIPEVPELEVAARYRAAGEENLVGGDFYDFFRADDDAWTAILGDVSGKGAGAAALTALTRHTLRAGALRDPSPKANLELLNRALLSSGGTGVSRFATVVYARICPTTDGALATICVGGHPPPVILRAGGDVEYVDAHGTLLGAVAGVQLEEVDVRLQRGDLLLLYTDGVTEVSTREPAYGERLLERVLREHAAAPAEAAVRAIERCAVEAQGGRPRDDIALIAVRARAASPPS